MLCTPYSTVSVPRVRLVFRSHMLCITPSKLKLTSSYSIQRNSKSFSNHGRDRLGWAYPKINMLNPRDFQGWFFTILDFPPSKLTSDTNPSVRQDPTIVISNTLQTGKSQHWFDLNVLNPGYFISICFINAYSVTGSRVRCSEPPAIIRAVFQLWRRRSWVNTICLKGDKCHGLRKETSTAFKSRSGAMKVLIR